MVPVSDGHGGSESARLCDPARALFAFRSLLYGCFGRRADALFELCDALVTTGSVPSPVHLSLVAIHRRGWGSFYAALSKGRIDAEALKDLLASHNPGVEGTPVYAVDVSPWPRCDAEASPGRGYLYHPSRHSTGQPIVSGWAYQLVARLSFERDSRVAPVDARRVEPEEDANDIAVKQTRALVTRLRGSTAAPLFVFDAGYDPVRLQLGFEGHRTQILVGLNSGRSFYFDPEPPPKRPVGRPLRHGEEFDLKDPQTWLGIAPQDAKSERALRLRERLCGSWHGGTGGGRAAATGREAQRT